MEYLHEKHFTLEQARMILTGIIRQIEEIVILKKKLDAKGYNIYRHEYFGGSGPNGERYFPRELEELVKIAREMDKKGILIKGFDQGLIDFPYIRSNGEEVYLCWKVGEDDIHYWHRIADGFAGRKAISDL
jgi:hypothetical protein